MPEQLAAARQEQIKKAGAITCGSPGPAAPERGEPNYYRIQAAAFLIEFDETQDHANHIHSVWRDFNGDFGRDLLKEHYQTSHQTTSAQPH